MATLSTQSIAIRLICKSMPDTPAADGALDIGIQDKAQTVHAGRNAKNGAVYFECVLEACVDGLTQGVDFRGPFVHGTPQSRFLYLSWKRRTASEAPWYWRVKIPLAGIAAQDVLALQAAEVLSADITGRRPHATDPIIWKRGVANQA